MVKTIVGDYIVAFSASSENDTEYEKFKQSFFEHGEATTGYTWMMKKDGTMVQVALTTNQEDVNAEDALAELMNITG